MSHPNPRKDKQQVLLIARKRLPATAMHQPRWQYQLLLRDEKLFAPIIITVEVEQIADVQDITACFPQWRREEEPPQT